jgi:tetratricopeptide (TPR) repeat protein
VALFNGLSTLIKEGHYPEALDRAKRGLQSLQDTDKALSAELQRLRNDPGANDSRADAILASAEAMLQGLKVGEPELRGKIDELTQSIERGKDPARFEKEFRSKDLIARIKQYLERGEGDDALMVYDQLVELLGTDAVKAERDRLKAEWTPKSADHRAARDYLTRSWRNVSTASEFMEAMPRLKKATQTLIQSEDRYGLRGLLASLETAYTRIKDLTERVGGDTPSERAILQTLQEVSKTMDEIAQTAREKLKELDAKATNPSATTPPS